MDFNTFELPYYASELPGPLPVFAPSKPIIEQLGSDLECEPISAFLVEPYDEILSAEHPSRDQLPYRATVRFGQHYAVLFGEGVKVIEAVALYFLNKYTSFRVPKLYACDVKQGFVTIYMEYLPGWVYDASMLMEIGTGIENANTLDDIWFAVETHLHQCYPTCGKNNGQTS
ncbi:hypothetical protein F5Y18DRAFT_438009 [Xylariaceae sp. FL1019]|nr:hypothetical protein F5Y18DRAFT_438009 [Xylariaceae sp. FL1019]